MPSLAQHAGGRYKVILLNDEDELLKDKDLRTKLASSHSHKVAEKLKKEVDKHLAEVRRKQFQRH